MEGAIFDIQHFCTHDGPGIRTTVFLKGCPLRCAWCHNPESQHSEVELWFRPARCISCGACDRVCPWGDARATLADAQLRTERCGGCSRCADACTSGTIERIGRCATLEEVLDEVCSDADYYRNSGGGVTLSGGEPLAQPDFVCALLEACRARAIGTAVETSGQASAATIERVARATDLLLWDVKSLDRAAYRVYTLGELDRMERNLLVAAHCGVPIRLRALYIPDLHDNRDAVVRLAAMADRIGAPIDVIPYHRLGDAKREQLGLARGAQFRIPDAAEVARFEAAVAAERGDQSFTK